MKTLQRVTSRDSISFSSLKYRFWQSASTQPSSLQFFTLSDRGRNVQLKRSSRKIGRVPGRRRNAASTREYTRESLGDGGGKEGEKEPRINGRVGKRGTEASGQGQ